MAVEIHVPNIIGPLQLSANEGTTGQVVTSAGPGAQVVWGNAPAAVFKFTSPSAVLHTITHNLNNAFPATTIWDTATGDVIVPSSVSSNGANSFDVTFFVARAIAGTVVG